MKKIVLVGAGKSSVYLLDYLLENAEKEDWQLTVADKNLKSAKSKTNGNPLAKCIALDIMDNVARKDLVKQNDFIISMLPHALHIQLAKDCLQFKKNLATASYVSEEMKALHSDVTKSGLLFINELGVDPGIDHMIAKKIIDALYAKGANITGFESFTGGLPSPESETGPWRYKFTWNPRNVVLAASQGAVKFKQCKKHKYIPYHKVFRRTELIDFDGFGTYEAYGNRDSLKYIEKYNLENIETIYRGTLRRPGFCRGWDVFVQLGATSDEYIMAGTESMTHRDFINSFLLYSESDSVELKLAHAMHLDINSEEMQKLEWLGLFSNEKVGLKQDASPARILQHILQKKWTLKSGEKDMVAMYNKVNYTLNDQAKELRAFLTAVGQNETHTAMAKTVGLPLGIGVKLALQGKIKQKGVVIPVYKEFYQPILEELEKYDIKLKLVDVKL